MTKQTDTNQLWKVARTESNPNGAGEKPRYATPELLWADCVAYFEWSDANPLQEERVGWYRGRPTVVNVSKLRAYTQRGLQLHLGIVRDTWQRWAKAEHHLSEVVNRANNVIFEMKFTAAAADQLNHAIIARELGLADKQDHTSSDGSMTPDRITRTIVKPAK